MSKCLPRKSSDPSSVSRSLAKVRLRISIASAVVKQPDLSSMGRRGLIQLPPPQHCSSLEGVRAGTQAGQEPAGRSWCRGHDWVQLTGLLLMACSACFLIESRTTSPGMASPTRDWALSHQSLIKKMTCMDLMKEHSQLSFPPLR